MCDPKGCATVVGDESAGGEGGGLVDANIRGRPVGRSAAGLPGAEGGGGVGTPTYKPKNDYQDKLIFLNTHDWRKKNIQEKFAHQLKLPSTKVQAGGWVGVKFLLRVFHPILNSPQNSEYFEYRHIGLSQKFFPCCMPETKYPAPPAPTKTVVPHNHFGPCAGAPPVATMLQHFSTGTSIQRLQEFLRTINLHPTLNRTVYDNYAIEKYNGTAIIVPNYVAR